MEHVTRLELVAVQARRLLSETRTCNDFERLRAINDELELLHRSALDIREEQLTEDLTRPPRKRSFLARLYAEKN